MIDAQTGCWVWIRALSECGYGKHSIYQDGKSKTVAAHVHSYETAIGPVPDGLILDHLCRNRACVNPSHLEPVTFAENTRRGLTAKLTVKDVENIRVRYADGGVTQASLAIEYSVMPSCIHKIVTGKSWTSDLTGQILTFDNPLQWERTKHGNHEIAASSNEAVSTATTGNKTASA